mgnify:CR=1 FL=1
MFAVSGMLFNHESPLRPERFVTRKICAAVRPSTPALVASCAMCSNAWMNSGRQSG